MRFRAALGLSLALVCLPLHAIAGPADNRVTVAIPLEPPGLDPAMQPAAAVSEVVWENIFEGLTRFDPSGNCRYLPHLRRMDWSYRNTLSRAVIIDRSPEGRPDDAEYYIYGGDGLRVRKITEQLTGGDGLRITEKIYLDGCEIKRISLNGRRILERKTSHLSDCSQRLAVLHRWSIDARRL